MNKDAHSWVAMFAVAMLQICLSQIVSVFWVDSDFSISQIFGSCFMLVTKVDSEGCGWDRLHLTTTTKPGGCSFLLKFVTVDAAKVEKVKQEDLVSYSEGRDGQNCKGYWSWMADWRVFFKKNALFCSYCFLMFFWIANYKDDGSLVKPSRNALHSGWWIFI